MLIEQKQEGSKGSFFVEEDGKTLAEMTYTMGGSQLLIIDHTEVDDVLRGRNVGNQLLNHVVEYARAQHYKILPLCPFARSVMDKKAELYGDVRKINGY
jgi:predicted GNAT family acetyltransferase